MATVSVAVLAATLIACESKPAATTATAPAPAATATPSPPPSSPRRERAGIEPDAPARPALPPAAAPAEGNAAAEVVAAPVKAKAPARKTGAEVDKAASALAFVRGPWRTAVMAGEPSAYTRLLAADFQVSLPPGEDGAARAVARSDWATHRSPSVSTSRTLLLGSPSVRFDGPPVPRVHVTFAERVDGASGCRVLNRTLSLVEVDGSWRVAGDDGINERDCPPHTPADVTSAWSALASAAATDDPERLALRASGGIKVQDAGVEVANYSLGELSNGAGRWILDAIKTTTANPPAMRLVGDEVTVTLTTELQMVLGYLGGAWRLKGVDRARPAGAGGD